jgi:hypothetical protein
MKVDTFAMARVQFKPTFMVSFQKFVLPVLVMEGNSTHGKVLTTSMMCKENLYRFKFCKDIHH